MVCAGPQAAIVCGDMNIVPTDDDVFDPEAYAGQTHVTPPEREALAHARAAAADTRVRHELREGAASRIMARSLALEDVPSAQGVSSPWLLSPGRDDEFVDAV